MMCSAIFEEFSATMRRSGVLMSYLRGVRRSVLIHVRNPGHCVCSGGGESLLAHGFGIWMPRRKLHEKCRKILGVGQRAGYFIPNAGETLS